MIPLVHKVHAYEFGDKRPGYIVTLEGDTLRGKVGYHRPAFMLTTCHFQGDSLTYFYDPQDILAYGFDSGKAYVQHPNGEYFIEVLVEGTISLWEDYGEYLLYDKRTSTYTSLNRGTNLWYIFGDVPDGCTKDLKPVFEGAGNFESGVVRAIVKYNECLGAEQKIYKNDLPFFSVNVGLEIGYMASVLKPGGNAANYNYTPENYGYSFSPTYGVKLILNNPRVYDRLGVRISGHYYTSHYVHQHWVADAEADYYYTTTIKASHFSLPIGLIKQKDINRSFSIYYEGGGLFDFQYGDRSNWVGYRRVGNDFEVLESSSSPVLFNFVGNGFWAGFGFQRTMGNHALLQLQTQYARVFGLSDLPGLRLTARKYSVSLNLLYR